MRLLYRPWYRFAVVAIVLLLLACNKVDITFGSSGGDDPALSYIDTFTVQLATWQPDSFVTAGHNVFAVGYHTDPVFGTVQAGAYLQIDLPSNNPLRDQQVSFDSLELVLKSNGEYYGDTTLPFYFKVHQLAEKIENEDANDGTFYNPRRFAHLPAVLGQKRVVISPRRSDSVSIRLSDALGLDLFNKFRTYATVIREQDDFVDYFKGIYIGTDTTVCKNLYYFTAYLSNAVIRMHYRLNGVFTQQRHFDFNVNPGRHYNYVNSRFAGTPLGVFTPFKQELRPSSSTANRAYLLSAAGTNIKISFPHLLPIQQLYPYTKIIKAELRIKPAPGTYNYPYRLPEALNLYGTDDNNRPNYMVMSIDGSKPQDGSLMLDNLFGENTRYTYDVTEFVVRQLQEGTFSKSALLLMAANNTNDNTLQRLVINNQSVPNSIQLRMYVLGL
jgi:hypothetical protein